MEFVPVNSSYIQDIATTLRIIQFDILNPETVAKIDAIVNSLNDISEFIVESGQSEVVITQIRTLPQETIYITNTTPKAFQPNVVVRTEVKYIRPEPKIVYTDAPAYDPDWVAKDQVILQAAKSAEHARIGCRRGRDPLCRHSHWNNITCKCQDTLVDGYNKYNR